MDFELAEAFTLIDAQELERALPLCLALQKKYPKDISVAQACAQTFAGVGDSVNALRMFKRIAALEPDSFEASYNLAVALNTAGRDEEALRHYQKAMRLDPLQVDAQNNYASTLSRLGLTCSPEFLPLISWVHPLEMDHATQPIHGRTDHCGPGRTRGWV